MSFYVICDILHRDRPLANNFFTDLQDTTLALDFRVTVLEENGGSDGNSSVVELEVRVEALEGTAADHETRISAVETDVTGREKIITVLTSHTTLNLIFTF